MTCGAPSTFMHAILNKETGLREPGQLLSQASLVEVPEMDRFIIVTDVAVNIAPDIDQKVSIIRNAARLASCVGLNDPKIALLSALEVENPAIPSTVEAARIAEMLRDEFTIAGPLALDNAISPEAARHKGVEGPARASPTSSWCPTCGAGISSPRRSCSSRTSTWPACSAGSPVPRS